MADLSSHFNLTNTTAGSSFQVSGDVISKGKETTRLQVTDTDSRVAIAAKTISADKPQSFVGKLIDNIRYVKISKGSDQIAINYGSLGRIGISKSEAQEHAKAGTLLQHIQTKARDTSDKLKKMDAYSSEVLNKYDHVKNDKAELTKGSLRAGLSKQELQKVTWLAVNTVTTSAKVIKTSKSSVLVQIVAGNTLHLTALHNRVHLGSGAFGTVSRVVDITNASHMAMKLAGSHMDALELALEGAPRPKPGHMDKAKHDVISEAKMLIFLGPQKGEDPPDGVQVAPLHTAFDIQHPEMTGYVGAEYDKGDLDNAASLFDTPEKKLDATKQLFSGLAHCQKRKIRVGDIKWPNILVRTHPKEPGNYQAHLSDMGGARKLEDTLPPKGWPIGTHTSSYLIKADESALKAAHKAISDATPETKQQAIDRYNGLQHKRDAFALGVATFKLMTGLSPYSKKDDRPDEASIDKALNSTEVREKLSQYGPGAQAFFEAVLNPDINKRLLPEDAREMLDALVVK